MKRMLLIGLGVLVGLGIVSFATTKTFHVEVFVPADPEAVWAVLMDTDSYADWNPVFVKVEGQYVEGGTVTSHVRFPDGSVPVMDVSVDVVAEAQELRQSGGVPGFITFDHRWLLQPAEGGTKVVQHEVDRGIYLWFWDSSWIEPAYQRVSDALGARVMEPLDE